MNKNFDYFVKKIPDGIHNNTKSLISEHIAIFIPERFVINQLMKVEEYHFVIFHSTPPPVSICGKQYQFKKGSIIYMAPGDEILVHPFDKPIPAKYMAICVNKEFFEKGYKQLGVEGRPLFKKINSTYSNQLLDAIDSLVFELLNYGELNPLMIECLETRLLIQLMRDSGLKLKELSNNTKIDMGYVQNAIKFIETYYSSNIKIKDICDAIYISPAYFQKIFVKSTNKTPYQYIMDCRLKKAKKMLKTMDIPIEEIAKMCGFVNVAHFSSTFKKREGISPLTYRKR
jgi:AraC-like DNA-binding protein